MDFLNETVEYDALVAFDPFHQFAGREAALIGGYGSGKSVALCAELLKQALEQPGSEWLLARKVVNSLAITTEKTFLDMMPAGLLKASHIVRGGGHVQYLDLPTGSRIHFKGLDDWRKIKSLNLAGFFLDEADEIDQESYEGLKSRIRQTHPLKAAGRPRSDIIRSGIIRIAMNPNGHDYYWQHFIEHQARSGPKNQIVGTGDRMAFLSTSLDNPYNPFSYIEDLLNMPEPWVRRYVFCSFDDFQGVIYPEWDWNTHTVAPYSWYDPRGLFMMGMDPGTQNPTAGVWCYIDHQLGAIVAVAEYLAPGVDVTSHVHAWRRIEHAGTHNVSRRPGRMRVSRRIADPSIATRDRGSMTSLESLYARHAFHFEHGPKNIPDRLPPLGELIHTKRFLVTKECELLYEQLKNYRYEDLSPNQIEKGVEAKPMKRNVDAVDAAQYIASRWISPAVTRPLRVPRPQQRIESAHDREILARIAALKDEGMLEEADLLTAELIPDGALEDMRHGIVRRPGRKLRSPQSAGLV